MQIPPKIVLLALATVMIVEPPGWTVAKITSKHGKEMSPAPKSRSPTILIQP